ncbi:MAG: CoA pyrophosphatase [Bacteroidota bacterium]
MFNQFIRQLKHQLSLQLPGHEAHDIMSSSLKNYASHWDHKGKPHEKSAVMILLYPKNNSIYSVLIKRPDYEGYHGGQISLPGGKFENGDSDLQQTALRETYEEIGINPKKIIVTGEISMFYIPVSNIEVYPYVGYVDKIDDFLIDQNEVAELIEYPIFQLTDKKIVHTKTMNFFNYEIHVPYYLINENHVWGATAMMLSEFSEILKKINL